ncbi:Adaptive-response sensory-kinase SasA [Pseudochrobactrum sp. MP213Fo]
MTLMKNKDFQRPADRINPESKLNHAETLHTAPAASSTKQTLVNGMTPVFPIQEPALTPPSPPDFNPTDPAEPHIPLRRRLSSKLLLMIVLAVLIAEVIILVPSIANMRNQWMTSKHNMISTASLLLRDANPGRALTPEMQEQLLRLTNAQTITVTRNGTSQILATTATPPVIDERIDLTTATPFTDFWGALKTLIGGSGKAMLISGPTTEPDTFVDVVLYDTALHNKLMQNSRIIANISLLISLIAAALIYFIIHRLLLRPVGHMYENMFAFARKPDDPTLIIDASHRNDELGYAQNRLAQMQTHLQNLFHERKHLADLGLAVSKINHDMRNILASAQLMSDSLADTQDPVVQRYSPKLIRTLNRAITYSETVLAYGRTQEAIPVRHKYPLRPLLHEVEEMLTIPANIPITFRNMVPADFEAYIDKEQMLRVLNNLCRNSIQAMVAHETAPDAEKSLTISAWRIGTMSCIAVADTGPGLPQKARDNLFTAFSGSSRNDGTGLGLVIAQELVRAHGGAIELREDYKTGALFEIRIPDMPVYFHQTQQT